MNKRSFLKATGVTFVASLFAAPFLGRRESEANAQESGDLAAQIEALRKQLQNETDDRKAGEDEIKRELEESFIGTVTAIVSNKIPYGWHLCDGTAIPDTPDFKRLKDMTGLTNFPDYRGVFLRGLDEGVGKDPGRELNTYQDSDNKRHNHGCDSSGAHAHGMDVAGGHNHMANNTRAVKPCWVGDGRCEGAKYGGKWPENVNVDHTYDIPDDGAHAHGIHQAGAHAHGIQQSGIDESRPKNVSVRYVIKYA